VLSGPSRQQEGELTLKDLPDGADAMTLSRERVLLRHGGSYFLRMTTLFAEPFGGDILLGVTFVAVALSGVQHLDPAVHLNALAADGVIPDGMRRPVTIASVARTLAIPRETARRYVNRLIAIGYLRPAGARGVIVPAEVMRSEIMTRVAGEHIAGLRALFDACGRTGGPPAPASRD
jgi:hypothetical protein